MITDNLPASSNDNIKSSKSAKGIKKTYTKHEKLKIGFDIEYTVCSEPNPESEGELIDFPNVVTLQLALNGKLEVSHPDLIATRYQNGYTGFVFKPNTEKLLGLKYLMWLDSCIQCILDSVQYSVDTSVDIDLICFYSNAELSPIFPNKKYLGEILKSLKKGVDGNTPRRMEIIPIQGVANVMNCSPTLPANVCLNIKDARLLSSAKSLKQLSANLDVIKGDVDFQKHDAKWYLENDFENFIDYGVRDAIIPLMWVEKFQAQAVTFAEKLAKEKIISETSAKRLAKKEYATASSFTDNLMYEVLKNEGQLKRYQDFTEYMGDRVIPRKFYELNKGGFNKSSHGFEPEYLRNLDGFDISGAYAKKLETTKFPTGRPTKNHIYNDGKGQLFKFSNLNRFLDNYPVAFVIADFVELPIGTPENKRILNLYDKDGECVTARMSDNVQMISGIELQAQALLTPDAKINVIQVIGWDKREFRKMSKPAYNRYITFEKLYSFLRETRVEYKEEFGKKSVEQELIKLFGNGGVGKLAQNKEGFDTNYLLEALANNGAPSSILKKSFKSKCHNPLMFNYITACVRVATGLSYALSDGVLAVTDSVACPHGKFLDSKTIASMIDGGKFGNFYSSNLIENLKEFDWEQEHDNCSLQLYKERDYSWLEWSNEKSEFDFEAKLKAGIAGSVDLKDCSIRKIAKRGLKQAAELTDREKGEEFVLLGNKRFSGLPIKQKAKRLTKFNEMLTGSKNLNQAYATSEDSPGMGSYNLKYLCDSTSEYERRKRVKSICRANGYADQLHVKVTNPELLEKFEKKAKCRENGNNNLDSTTRLLIAFLQIRGGYSARGLEALINDFGLGRGIGKSSLNRIKKECEASEISSQLLDDVVEWLGDATCSVGLAVKALKNILANSFASILKNGERYAGIILGASPQTPVGSGNTKGVPTSS